MKAIAALMVLASASAAAQSERDVFAQRALARALDDRCGFFSENERLALDSAYLETRGNLLRSGFSAREIDSSYDQVIRNASGRPCDSAEALAIAAGIQSAFPAWQRERSQTFVGAPNAWSATRPFAYDSWVIAQQLPSTELPAIVGVYNHEHERALTIAVNRGTRIASLALIARDPDITPEIHDPSLGGLLQIAGAPPWTSYLPPETGHSRFLPSGHRSDEALDYYVFQPAVLDALAALDPREAIRIEAFDPQGNILSRQYVGIGDFAAALAFVNSSPDMSAGR